MLKESEGQETGFTCGQTQGVMLFCFVLAEIKRTLSLNKTEQNSTKDVAVSHGDTAAEF